MLLLKLGGNAIVKMLFNDLVEIYLNEGSLYFDNDRTKYLSLEYYDKLRNSIVNDKSTIKKTVKQIMMISLKIWERETDSDENRVSS